MIHTMTTSLIQPLHIPSLMTLSTLLYYIRAVAGQFAYPILILFIIAYVIMQMNFNKGHIV